MPGSARRSEHDLNSTKTFVTTARPDRLPIRFDTMQLIKVAAAAVNQTPLDWEGNRAHIASAIESARREGVSVICLPELCITGYGCEDAFHSAGVQQMARRVLLEILPETKGLIVSLGLLIHFAFLTSWRPPIQKTFQRSAELETRRLVHADSARTIRRLGFFPKSRQSAQG